MANHIVGSVVFGQDILLDGGYFKDSTFNGCRFIYNGGAFPKIIGCKINDSEFHLFGPPRKNRKFAAVMKKLGVVEI